MPEEPKPLRNIKNDKQRSRPGQNLSFVEQKFPSPGLTGKSKILLKGTKPCSSRGSLSRRSQIKKGSTVNPQNKESEGMI